MKHVFYGFKNPTSFEEHLDFNFDVPYTIRIKYFHSEEIVPLHYAKTIEILLCEDLKGQVTIHNNKYILSGKQIFIIPPFTVHSNTIHTCGGRMFVVKFELDMMANFLNLPALFGYNNRSINSFSYTCPEYDAIYKIIEDMIENDEDIFLCLSDVIKLFRVLFNCTNSCPSEENTTHSLKGSDLHELINWTQKNFSKKITLDDVATKTGYNKYYFCNLFKAKTGSTYLNYLNSVRISHSCRLLKEGKSITEASFLCGFENVSYYIQLFKKIHGTTPKQYLKNSKVANIEYSNMKLPPQGYVDQ